MAAELIASGVRPKVAILREQGVNGQVEMAAAFDRAGFEAIDVHMSDILSGRITLDQFRGLVACGGFSYGDVLGAGEGWAKSILFNTVAREEFSAFFEREDTFALGVCNGCQMLSNLHELIPGPTSGRTLCVTNPSSSRPVWRWWKSRTVHPSSCRVWLVLVCQSLSLMVKAVPNLKMMRICAC